jgi:hypothetical protein
VILTDRYLRLLCIAVVIFGGMAWFAISQHDRFNKPTYTCGELVDFYVANYYDKHGVYPSDFYVSFYRKAQPECNDGS